MGRSPKFTFTGGFYLLGAFLLLVIPIKWLLASALAACFHELCHYAILKLCRCRVFALRFSASGIYMQTEAMTPGKEFLCALAGPIGGMSLILLCKYLPRTAICAAVYSAYNLLPVYPLDGGRCLRIAARMLFPPKASYILCSLVESCVLLVLLFVGCYGAFAKNTGLLSLLLTSIPIIKLYKGKIPCKPWRQKVQ